MIPILFDRNETAFISNGLARLRDTLEAVVVEERNGMYELDFSYPVDGANYSLIECGRFVGVTHDESGDIQPFEITSVSRPINGVVTFHAVHLSYRQKQMVVSGTNINSLSDAFTLLGTATPSNPFTYETDITSSGYMSSADGTPLTVRQMLGGVQGSILDAYGGEFEWDKWRVILHQSRGEVRDFAIRYGVNLLDYNDDTDYANTFTSCVAYWKGADGTIVTATATTNENGYNGNDIRVPLDLSDKFEDEPTSAQLQTEALSYMNRNQTVIPSQSIRVNFVRLADMEEFDNLRELLNCKLCDSLRVIFPMYDVSAYFKIVKTEWNVLEDKFIGMELGTLSTTLSEALGIGDTSSSTSSGGGSGVDYITEEGTEGIWTWRKWSSGIAECWGTMSQTITGWATWGNLYEGTASTHTATYPNGLFSSTPDFWANGKGSSIGYVVETYSSGSATTTPEVYAVRGNSGSTGTINISLYAKGTSTSLNRDVHLEQSGDVLIMS